MKLTGKTKKYLFIFGLFFSLFGMVKISSATTPTVSGVSGTVSTGNTLTITGSTMVDENKSNWLPEFQSGNLYGFEGLYSEQVSEPGWEFDDKYNHAPDLDPGEMGYDSDVKIMGNSSYYGRIVGAHASNASSGLYVTTGVNRGALYARLYSRWHSAGTVSKWPASHIKMIDMQGSGGTDQMYFQPEATNGSTLPTNMSLTYNSANHLYPVDNFLQDNRWYSMEVYWNNTASPRFTAWVDGKQISDITSGLGNLSGMDAILFNMINLSETGSDFDLTNWTDNFAVSTSRIYPSSTIEISNNATYGNGTMKYQEPIYLSDGSVQIKADLTGLGAGPYYLFVTNNRQERSAAYNLSGGDTTAPSAPSGLSVL